MNKIFLLKLRKKNYYIKIKKLFRQKLKNLVNQKLFNIRLSQGKLKKILITKTLINFGDFMLIAVKILYSINFSIFWIDSRYTL